MFIFTPINPNNFVSLFVQVGILPFSEWTGLSKWDLH